MKNQIETLTEEELEQFLQLLPSMSDKEKRDFLDKLERFEKTRDIELSKSDFLHFVKRSGRHSFTEHTMPKWLEHLREWHEERLNGSLSTCRPDTPNLLS